MYFVLGIRKVFGVRDWDGQCMYCRKLDLSGLNSHNKTLHINKCKKLHPYPLFKPVKRVQTKLSFTAVLIPPPPQPEPLPYEHFEIERPTTVTTTESVTMSQQPSSTSQIP